LGRIQDYVLHHLEIMISWQKVIRALKVFKQVLGGFCSFVKVDLPLHQELPECCLRQVLDALIQHACPIREVRGQLPRVWLPIQLSGRAGALGFRKIMVIIFLRARMLLFIDQRRPSLPDLRLHLSVQWAVHVYIDVDIHVCSIIADKRVD
jgi:hypothetical protein